MNKLWESLHTKGLKPMMKLFFTWGAQALQVSIWSSSFGNDEKKIVNIIIIIIIIIIYMTKVWS
jgi:hypothetical protein